MDQEKEISETSAPDKGENENDAKEMEHAESTSVTDVEGEQLDGSWIQPPTSAMSQMPAADACAQSPGASMQSGVSGETEDQPGSPGVEEPLTPATDNSSTSKSQPGSGRVTPASQSDQSQYLSSSEKPGFSRKRKSIDSGVRQLDFDNQSTSSGYTRNPRFPFRAGISWRKGERLEAMDFMHKWFPAKIREINEEELTALIHFDGWNQRFDEWVDMTSDRIRPLIRHSGRKDKNKRVKTCVSLQEHRIGEQVYAKWTDCKMYPAKITGIMPNGSYEVIFYDGFKKQVQPINIRPMPGELKSKAFDVAPAATAAPRKGSRRGSSTVTTPDSGVPVKSPPCHRTRRESHGMPRSEGKSRSRKNKVIPMDQFVPKDLLVKDDGTDPGLAATASVHSEPVSTQTDYMETKPEVKEEALIPEVVPTPSIWVNQPPQSAPVDTKPLIQSAVPVLPPKAFVVESDHNQYKCHFEGCNKSFRKEPLLEYHIKYYHVEDTDPMVQTPTKRRKKTISVCSSESDSTPFGRKWVSRKSRYSSSEALTSHDLKQEVRDEGEDSILATEGIKQETGEISTQTSLARGLDVAEECGLGDSLHQHLLSQDSLLTEESSVTDVEEFLKPDELVNCICDYYEENGLMIQCEVCLCWQHASCFGITERTLPKTYVCFVCENPPGVRESSRYIHEQDWFKLGEIASFNYLPNPQGSEEQCDAIRQTHSLVAELHHLNSVMHSLKLQLHILRAKDEQKLKLWRLDWDTVETFPDGEEPAMGGGDKDPSQDTEKSEGESRPVTFSLGSSEDAADVDVICNRSEVSSSGCEVGEVGPGMAVGVANDSTGKVQEVSGEPEEEAVGPEKDVGEVESDKTAVDHSESKQHPSNGSPTAQATNSHSEQVITEAADSQPACEMEHEEAVHSDSTESVVEDPVEMYERNLLNHIHRTQADIDDRLDKIEEQVAILEGLEAASSMKERPTSEEAMADFPQLKKTMRTLHNDLYKVKKMAVFH